MPTTKQPPKLKLVRLELAPRHHQQLREMAAAAAQPMSRFVRALVEREIDREIRRKTGPEKSGK